MTIELDLLLVELRNRTYTDKTIPAVVYYLEILNKQLRLARDVASLKEAQGQHGTWDSDDYMRGLFNGLELASSILEQREPKFKPVFTDLEKKDEEIRTLKRCLFQMQEAAKELVEVTKRQSEIIGVPQKPAIDKTPHQNWCASLNQTLLSNPPQPAPCNCKKPLQESDVETEYTEDRGRIFKEKYWRNLSDEEFDKCDAHETWRSMQNVAQMLKEKNT